MIIHLFSLRWISLLHHQNPSYSWLHSQDSSELNVHELGLCSCWPTDEISPSGLFMFTLICLVSLHLESKFLKSSCCDVCYIICCICPDTYQNFSPTVFNCIPGTLLLFTFCWLQHCHKIKCPVMESIILMMCWIFRLLELCASLPPHFLCSCHLRLYWSLVNFFIPLLEFWGVTVIEFCVCATVQEIVIIMALKGVIWEFLQSPQSAVNCLQHVRSSGQGAIVCMIMCST